MTPEKIIEGMRSKMPGLRINLDGVNEWVSPSQSKPCRGCRKKQVNEVAAASAELADEEYIQELLERR